MHPLIHPNYDTLNGELNSDSNSIVQKLAETHIQSAFKITFQSNPQHFDKWPENVMSCAGMAKSATSWPVIKKYTNGVY